MRSSAGTQKQPVKTRQESSGIIVVDKPQNITSARVVAEVKRLLDARKVGHAGTLDPFAAGVLVCCINDATRLARFLLAGAGWYPQMTGTQATYTVRIAAPEGIVAVTAGEATTLETITGTAAKARANGRWW